MKLADRDYLFDGVAHPRERANLRYKDAAAFARLRSDFAAWNATMLPYPAESNSESTKENLPDRY